MNQSTFLTCVLFVFVASLYSCQQTPPAAPELDQAAITAEITAMEAAYGAAVNAKDLEGILNYYANDATQMPPNHPSVEGIETIRAREMEQIAKDTSGGKLTLETRQVWAAGDLAVESGSWSYQSADGQVVDAGKFISVFEKRDGKYKCIRDIWNSDMPAKSGSTDSTEGSTE